MNNSPIAVVDSGVGGLACLSAIRSAMPGEDIIYFGDTAHMPFGSKTTEEVCGYARSISLYLESQGVKMIILACGTMSSVAVNAIYEACPNIIVQGIIEPAVSVVARNCEDGARVGVIATPRTIESGSHKAAFERIRKKYDMYYKGCPELASLIERGVTEGPELEALLEKYLDEIVEKDGVEALLLGCTHYPLVSECINKLYPKVSLLDPAELLARMSSSMLKVHGFDADSSRQGSIRICASKYTDSFRRMADMLGFGDISIEEVKL